MKKALLPVVGIVFVVFLAILVALTSKSANVKDGSPEATLQMYLQAVIANDSSKAVTYLEADSKCTISDFDRDYISDEAVISIEDSRVDDLRATIKVRIEHQGDLLGDTYTNERTFNLIKSSGEWKIIGMPWPLNNCGGQK